MHQPGVIPRKARTALLPTFRRGIAPARDMGAVPRAMDLGMAKTPQPGDNAQAQG
ncbi:hypothetical protein J2Y66_002303 [Paenarthrobacter nitroguajacolicus]|nr:hypothetical protein [Paenarthrobacter nitroguajacolicus]MDR6987805.1 hypothetical protein [Paenarthrobacter nitroguajacolicus]